MKKLFKSILPVMAILAIVLVSCGGSDDIFTDVYNNDNFAANVESYFMKDMPDAAPAPTGQRVYIDFSNGMWQAYKGNSNNSAMIETLTQRLTSQNVQWFGLGKGEIYKLDLPSTQIYNKVTEPSNYSTEIMAPIEKTIQQIIEGGEEALLVTDFEEYTTDGQEQLQNFAADEFIKWLKMGNSITFYVANYQEKNAKTKRTVDKHLYFIVFNTAANKLKADVEYAWKDRGYTYEQFELSTDIYSLENKYAAADKGGQYYDQEGNDIVFAVNNYVNGLINGKNYELYASQSTWQDIHSNSSSLMEAGVPKQFTHVFRNLFIDLSHEDVFKVSKLGVKVTNVADDFKAFINAAEAAQHTPKMSKDASGNVIIDPEEVDPIALECYDNKGVLKDKYKYVAKESTNIAELLELDEALFNNSLKTDKTKAEIGVKFHKNFVGTPSNPSGLFRVDIVIEDCTPNFEKLDKLFSWSSPNVDKTNNSLAEAIRNTLTEVNPKGKVIYSYFIKTLD